MEKNNWIIQKENNYIFIKVLRDITIDVNDAFSTLLKNLEIESKDIILDLSSINFISSTGFGVIARTHQNLQEEGKKLFILNPAPSIEHLLKIINFDKFIPFIKSIEERKTHRE